jgi:hypothetical protein
LPVLLLLLLLQILLLQLLHQPKLTTCTSH